MSDGWEAICEAAASRSERRIAVLQARLAVGGGLIALGAVAAAGWLLFRTPASLGWISGLAWVGSVVSVAAAALRFMSLGFEDPPLGAPASLAADLRRILGEDPGDWLDVEEPGLRARRRWYAAEVVRAHATLQLTIEAALVAIRLLGLGLALALFATAFSWLGFYLVIPAAAVGVWLMRPRLEI